MISFFLVFESSAHKFICFFFEVQELSFNRYCQFEKMKNICDEIELLITESTYFNH